MKIYHLVCSCYSAEHTLRYVYDEDNDEVYTEVYLSNHKNILKRVWVAIKYVFGYKSKYGHFDCTSFSKTEAKKLSYFLRNYVK